MENFKDFLKQINVRISNPFIFSFLISWLIWNWKIVIVLAFYNKYFFEQDKYSSYIDFITKNTNYCTTLICPLVFGLVYTFLFPLFTLLVKAFQTRVDKESNNWNLRILKGGKIGIEKYMSLRNELDVRRDFIEEIINKESSIKTELEQSRSEVYRLQSSINSNDEAYRKERDRYEEQNGIQDLKLIQGKWRLKVINIDGGQIVKDVIVEFENNIYFEDYNNKPQKVATIEYYRYKIEKNKRENNNVFFVKSVLDSNNKVSHKLVNELVYKINTKTLEGTENGQLNVVYTPISEPPMIIR